MPLFVYIFCQTVNAWITLTLLAMLLRSLRSLITFGAEESALDVFLVTVTEPVILPVRLLMGESVAEMPLDIPYMLTYILLIFLQSVLPSVAL